MTAIYDVVCPELRQLDSRYLDKVLFDRALFDVEAGHGASSKIDFFQRLRQIL